jgi:uncharacterized protein
MQLLKRIKLKKRSRKILCRSILIICLAVNILAYVGAYSLTHFSPGSFGGGLIRPSSTMLPSDIGLVQYVTHRIPIGRDEWVETWLIPVANDSKGTVILFPGNGGSKSKQLLSPARVFHSLGYDTVLVDFRGVGGSSGNTTTLGMREAEDVALSVSYAQTAQLKHPVILYGISMGTSAILKAVAEKKVDPDAIVLELPFEKLVDAVGSRVRATSLPAFPLTELIVFWGSVQHGFNGFNHNPVDYASQVKCPTLIFHGKLDRWTATAQIERIFKNLRGTKQLSIFPNAGHDLLVTVDRSRWEREISKFLNSVK